jgi:aspartate beta-hydroxylase
VARPLIRRAAETARALRRDHLRGACAPLRQEHGTAALQRIDRAIDALTAPAPLLPADVRQRPKFLYVPDLPSEPYLDPFLVPWARRLAEAYEDIRREALDLFASGAALPSFLDFNPGDRLGDYLGGEAAKPAWDAFFFYRHGERFDDNHRRCPKTSAVLESLELFRIKGQSPEICFSFLAPQTTIQPHYGVSNTRLVMHLPLLVPRDCALNLVGVGEHRWREGELLLFDDTYLHEAWNRSDEMRIVLLMDCWNPRLSEVERRAVAALIEASSEFDRAV